MPHIKIHWTNRQEKKTVLFLWVASVHCLLFLTLFLPGSFSSPTITHYFCVLSAVFDFVPAVFVFFSYNHTLLLCIVCCF